MNKYAELLQAEYISFNETPKKPYTHVFAFIIPQKETFDFIVKKFNPNLVMTVCETEPVHENYRLIFDTFKTVLVPSQFCKDIFHRQFGSDKDIIVFPHWPGYVIPRPPIKKRSMYTFYTIGNIIDPRKNIQTLIETFLQCPEGSRLLIKATCIQEVKLNIPNVVVINGLLGDDEMEKIHEMGDCYVNCSHSEGVGMGAVEAALRNKPVIISDFGGLKEYVKTPFVVSCEETKVGVFDFLFEPHMKWGNPRKNELLHYMKHCQDNDIRTWDHEYTREFTSWSVLRAKFSNLSSALTGSSI